MNTIHKFILLPVVLNLFDAVINKTTSATTGNDLSGEMKSDEKNGVRLFFDNPEAT